ncbi:NBP2b protein [Anopheles darlingi]|uniref:NBP2b protein n=1 Tax=Anopheles darlingi TaxID=43151 RepID=W5JAA2_ANODA|nr:protein FAM32A [Anopheles darlingi]ETN59785.1 NBP2b protein [Anopheles darlingi]
MADEYEHVNKSKLKLRVESDIKKKHSKKSKKKSKDKTKMQIVLEDARKSEQSQRQTSTTPNQPYGRVLTKAEEAFKKMQEKKEHKRIVEKAQMTHKQRVEQFNQHLDSLTEHFDIPKVSWTK